MATLTSALTAVVNRLLSFVPASVRPAAVHAVVLWGVTFAALIAQLGSNGLSVAAIAGTAVAAGRLVCERVLPTAPVVVTKTVTRVTKKAPKATKKATKA